MRPAWLAPIAAGLLLAAGAPAEGAVADTLHNLSASGPGAVKAAGVGEICIFCHTPHRAVQTRALWNRSMPGVTYTLYGSSTLQSRPSQPSGSTRLCLSCHDGVLALGNLAVAPGSGPVSLGPLTGRTSLGTDLSDDHPVSFAYDAALAARHGQLVDPAALPRTVRLDDTGQLQCTACHEPHSNQYRKFLRADDRSGGLCLACHRPRSWAGGSHAISTATWRGTGANPWPGSPYATVAENACRSCHASHAAPRPVRLLTAAQERAVCLVCHAGSVAAKNLEPEFAKPSAHPVAATDWIHEPNEDPNAMARHVTCADCHNPHQSAAGTAGAPSAPPPIRGVRGLTVAGSVTAEAANEHEVCLKCHGVRDQTTPAMVRQDNTRNVRVEISPSNPSYHPVAAVGRNATIQGLLPGYTASSLVYCGDCHNNDEWTAAGIRPKGAHGSRYEPILEREYQQGDPSAESAQAYALCYKCHSRTTLLSAGRFPHSAHVSGERASCAVCHDAHGSRQNAHLINFMLRDRTGRTVVSPGRNGLLQYVSTGSGRGECSLSCHGQDHNRLSY